jgi:spore germination cell wall hydrolase CwlJ-like protein
MNNKYAAIIIALLLVVLLRVEFKFNTLERRIDTIEYTQSIKYTQRDVECLARNIYYEAGVESTLGKYAVATVTINRLQQKRYGNTICAVVYAPHQFSWTKLKQLEKPNPAVYYESHQIAQESLNGARVKQLKNVTYYHADYIQKPYWTKDKTQVTSIGAHIFYSY